MLVDEKVITKWNSRTKHYYENLGYVYTGMGTELKVYIEHLPQSSEAMIKIICDYCGKIFERRWNYYIKTHSVIDKDSCYDCCQNKREDTNTVKYGKKNPMEIDDFKENQKKSLIEKYGVDNVFKLESVKEIIRNVNLEKYGETSFTKTEEYREKTRNTCVSKYGETSHMKTEKYKEMFSGENSPVWKGGVHDERWDRLQPKYKSWRFRVFERDNFICQKCLVHPQYLEAHHILNWKDNIDLRYEVDNGISFCQDCHIEFHRIYGKINNNFEQLTEFLER